MDPTSSHLVKSKFQRDNEDPLQKDPLLAIMFRLENNMDNLLIHIFSGTVFFTKVSRKKLIYLFIYFFFDC